MSTRVPATPALKKQKSLRLRRRLVLDVYPRGMYHFTKIGNTTLNTPARRMHEMGAPRRGRYRLTITRDPAGDWTCHGTYIDRPRLDTASDGFSACYMRRHRWGPTPFQCTVTFQPASLWRVARHQ